MTCILQTAEPQALPFTVKLVNSQQTVVILGFELKLNHTVILILLTIRRNFRVSFSVSPKDTVTRGQDELGQSQGMTCAAS